MLRDNRLVDFSPKSNVHCCDVVSRPSEAAGLTSKFISSRSVSLRYMPTRGAGSGSVSRVNKDHRNTGNLGFVVYEHSEQSKIPGMQAATLSLSNRNSVSNALHNYAKVEDSVNQDNKPSCGSQPCWHYAEQKQPLLCGCTPR